MIRKLFGTDGIRGTANTAPMTAEIALQVGMAAGLHFTRGDHRHRVVIGKDTRLSGYMIEPALTAGFVAAGMDPILAGPLPTPAIAMLTRSLRADLGVMISASHNPYQDNGIKLFGPDGYKLSDEAEAAIEARMEGDIAADLAAPAALGRALRLDDAQGRYVEFVKRTIPRRISLDGIKVVIDCANGAAYKVAPAVLWELGAEVVPLAIEPDGLNINDGCGSTHPEAMCGAVVAHGAQMGIALDGDADRVLIADETGALIDGDQIMAVIAKHWADDGWLQGGAVVSTVMSNLGLEQYLATIGLNLLRTQVGDRYVVERMRALGCNLGGEQSGHIVMADHGTTGDGLAAALQLLSIVSASGKPVSEACRPFEPLPQILRNVAVNGAAPLEDSGIQKAIAAGEARMGGEGRVLIRASGTEPLVRVMAEGADKALIDSVVGDIVDEIERFVSA